MASKKKNKQEAAPWQVTAHGRLDKSFAIEGPSGFKLYVDYDDVCRPEADAAAKMIVRMLNKHLPQMPQHSDLPDHEC